MSLEATRRPILFGMRRRRSAVRYPASILFVLSLAATAWAQAALVIDGPTEGAPGQVLAFRLLSDGHQVSADGWEQILNPDRYRGHDYVTSFALRMEHQPDATLRVVAPAPGRYKLAAVKGGTRLEIYVLIRPSVALPEIRGVSLSAFEPLDRPYVADMLAVAKRAGMTWVDVVQTAWIDFDSGNLAVQAYCPRCPGSMPLEDLEWLIDEAHRQGLKVSLDPGVWARHHGVLDELQPTLEGTSLNPIPFPSDVQIGPNPTDPAIIPAVMQSYGAFMTQMAELAQRHGAEALILGNNASSPNHSLLWEQTAQWAALFAQLRQVYGGKLWMGFNWTCPNQAAVFDGFAATDGIHAGLSGDIASTPGCTFPLSGSTGAAAEEIAGRIVPEIESWRSFRLQTALGLPVIYTDFYTLNVDGANFLGSAVYQHQAVRDNQEIVDLFEAAMRTVGQRPGVGVFLWSAGLSRNGFANNQDPLKQPALMNAIANWWGGDTAYFARCLAADPPDLLFFDSFDRGVCPLERQNLEVVLATPGAAPTHDSHAPGNTVLRLTSPGGTNIGDLVNSGWTDYRVIARLRLLSGSDPVGMIQLRASIEGGWNAYGVHVGRSWVRLFKSVMNQSELLASYDVPGGTPLGRWFLVEVAVVGPTIAIKLDGRQVIQVTDVGPALVRGAVSLGLYGAGPEPVTVDFDDVAVRDVRQTAASLWLNKTSFRAGETVILGLDANNPPDGSPLELYVGALLPDGVTLVFFDGTGALTGIVPREVPAQFLSAQVLAPGSSVGLPRFLQYTFPAADIPVGTYHLFAALVRQGALADNELNPGDIVILDAKPLVYAP